MIDQLAEERERQVSAVKFRSAQPLSDDKHAADIAIIVAIEQPENKSSAVLVAVYGPLHQSCRSDPGVCVHFVDGHYLEKHGSHRLGSGNDDTSYRGKKRQRCRLYR